MKPALALLGVAAAATLLQTVAAIFVPPRFCPDLGFLLVLALGLVWRSAAAGLVLSALLGYATDLFSGALLGQHALVRLGLFASARLASRHLNLRSALPLATLAAVATLANALAIAALTGFFASGAGVDRALLLALVPHALANALLATPAVRGTEWLANRLGDIDGGRRVLRLETAGRST